MVRKIFRVQASGNPAIAKANRMRRAVTFRMTNGRCFYCGGPMIHKGHSDKRDWLFVRPVRHKMAQEHMTPISRGGANSRENYVPSCAACNWDKGQLDLAEYRFMCGLRNGSLSHRFALEPDDLPRRDWLICCSLGTQHQVALLLHNHPSAVEGMPRRRPVNSGRVHHT